MRSLVIAIVLIVTSICSKPTSACPTFEQELKQLQVLESLVDLSKPVDRKSPFYIAELEQRHLLMRYHFFKDLKLKADPKTGEFIYTTPSSVSEVVSSMDSLLSDPFIADLKMIDRSEVKDSVGFIDPLFVKLWKLEKGPIAKELEAKGISGSRNMVNLIFECYWDYLHRPVKISLSDK